MIETEQSVVIDVPIENVWKYVHQIERWANLMPGLRECKVINDHDSQWVLKVGVGGLVRTVTVDVHVDEWDGPENVTFSFQLQGDPVNGGGTYKAQSLGPNKTEITLRVQVVGSGPMAKMWEAMGKPLLPQFAKAFAQQLKQEIEADSPAQTPIHNNTLSPSEGWWGRLRGWIVSIFVSRPSPRRTTSDPQQ